MKLTAQDAKSLADKNITNGTVFDRIKEAALRGQKDVQISSYGLRGGVEQKLLESGYKIDYGVLGAVATISWDI